VIEQLVPSRGVTPAATGEQVSGYEIHSGHIERGACAALFIGFMAVAALFLLRLYGGDPSKIPSALIGQPAPQTTLPALEGLVRMHVARRIDALDRLHVAGLYREALSFNHVDRVADLFLQLPHVEWLFQENQRPVAHGRHCLIDDNRFRSTRAIHIHECTAPNHGDAHRCEISVGSP
jgi:hypothetical protein